MVTGVIELQRLGHAGTAGQFALSEQRDLRAEALARAGQGSLHYFFGGAAGSVEAGGPSEFHVSRTYSHLPSFFLETERYFPVSIT